MKLLFLSRAYPSIIPCEARGYFRIVFNAIYIEESEIHRALYLYEKWSNGRWMEVFGSWWVHWFVAFSKRILRWIQERKEYAK